MRILISIVVTLGVATGMYVIYLRSVTSGSAGSPMVMVSTATVQVQLVNIAQAERIYFAQNSTYATIEDLTSSGTLKLDSPDRAGYAYSIDVSASSFQATAHHIDPPGAKAEKYPVLSIDQTMQVQRSN